jgi:hypothetical protein
MASAGGSIKNRILALLAEAGSPLNGALRQAPRPCTARR